MKESEEERVSMFGGENGTEISKRESKKKKIDYKMFVCKRRYKDEDG